MNQNNLDLFKGVGCIKCSNSASNLNFLFLLKLWAFGRIHENFVEKLKRVQYWVLTISDWKQAEIKNIFKLPFGWENMNILAFRAFP